MKKAAPEALVEACAAAAADGSLVVLVDFDRTVTRCYTREGGRGTSAHGVLESADLLSEHFKMRAKELFDKYYPVEIHPTMSIQEKIPIMNEWYHQVHSMMVNERMTRENLSEAVASCKSIQLREGMEELLRHCQEMQPPIPVLIVSAGLADVIEVFLRQQLPFSVAASTRVVSNRLLFDDQGHLFGFSEPLLHMFNKSAAFFDAEAAKLARGRRACVLLGDGIGDATMADGLGASICLKLGFLNEKVEERFAEFDKVFDTVVVNDGPVPDACFRALGMASPRSAVKLRRLACAAAVGAAAVCAGLILQRRLRER